MFKRKKAPKQIEPWRYLLSQEGIHIVNGHGRLLVAAMFDDGHERSRSVDELGLFLSPPRCRESCPTCVADRERWRAEIHHRNNIELPPPATES